MTDKEKLAKIIRNNPGATLRVDNDNWYFVLPKPSGFDEWGEKAQEDWWEYDSELCESREFPTLGSNGGYGVLETMCEMNSIIIEGV